MPQPLMRRTADDDRRPWGMLIVLAIVVVAGTASLPLQVATYRQLGEASKAEQLRMGQQAICEQINDVARQAGLTPTDCEQINTRR